MSRRGATQNVLQAMGVPNFTNDGRLEVRGTCLETAPCRACTAPLRFGTDGDGMTYEACTNRGCFFHRPHVCVVDVSILKPPTEKKRRRKSKELVSG